MFSTAYLIPSLLAPSHLFISPAFFSLISSSCSRLVPLLHALRTGARDGLPGGQTRLLLVLALPHLGEGVDHSADETDGDGRHAGECDGGVEEDEAGDGDGELVQSADHGVCGGGSDADAPGGGVGDEDGRKTRGDHGDDDAVALLGGEVAGEVGRGPVLEEDGADKEDGDGEEVVVVHGWEESV